MIIEILFFIIGLILLVKGSDYFVKSAATIAERYGISEFVIGLTLVAIGTSMPELASSIVASMGQNSGLIIGNVVGSNIANIGLIVGISALLVAIKTNPNMLKLDGYIMLLAAVLFGIFAFDLTVTWWEALILLLFYIAYIVFLLQSKPEMEGKYGFKEFIRYFFGFQFLVTVKGTIISLTEKKTLPPAQREKEVKKGIAKDMVILIAGLVAVVIGANYMVEGAVFFANYFNLPQTLVGISIIAVGTSLPELSVSISAARKGFGEIAVGNILGSNIANIFLIVGVSGLIAPLAILKTTLYVSIPVMILFSVLLLVFIKTQQEISRKEGIIFVAMYFCFMAYLFYITI